MIELVPYQADLQAEWDALVRSARNGHFLFERLYMDYHAERFVDASFLFRDGKQVVAVLPGHLASKTLWRSHGGLTFGGLVVHADLRTPEILSCFAQLDAHLVREGIQEARYKPMPWFHQSQPAQEDLYALFLRKAQLVSRTLSTLHHSTTTPPLARQRRRNLSVASQNHVICNSDTDWETFWRLLDANLRQRHGVAPVHRLDEICLLAQRFPKQIRLWTARRDGEMLAGAVSYETPEVFHLQYSAASEQGRELGALTQLFHHLMVGPALSSRFFNFGHSCEDGGAVLNDSLLAFKESFGGHGAVYEEYAWTPGVLA